MIEIVDKDMHTHLKERMEQRGITRSEIERTLNKGWKSLMPRRLWVGDRVYTSRGSQTGDEGCDLKSRNANPSLMNLQKVTLFTFQFL